MRKVVRNRLWGQTSDVFDEAAWMKAFRERDGPLRFKVEDDEPLIEPLKDRQETRIVKVIAPGVIIDDVVQIEVPKMCTTQVHEESPNYQVLLKYGFICPDRQFTSEGCFLPHNILSTILLNRENLYYDGEKVIDVLVPTYGLSSLPRKYVNNMSVLMNGVRVVVSGTGSFNLMGCAVCSGDEDEVIILVKLESGVVRSFLITADSIVRVKSDEVAYFRKDSMSGSRYLIYPEYLETDVYYKSLKWCEGLTDPGIVCVDGQFFSVPLSRIVNLRAVQIKHGTRLLAKYSELILEIDYKLLTDVVACDLDNILLSHSLPFHSPHNVASAEIVNKVRNSVIFSEFLKIQRSTYSVELKWKCGGFGLDVSVPNQPSMNLLQVCMRRHKRPSILLCMAHAVQQSVGSLSVYDVYKRMENLPEVFVYGKCYPRYRWSGVCDDFYRYKSSGEIEKHGSFHKYDNLGDRCVSIRVDSQVVRVLVVCRSNFILRGLNNGSYFSDAHLRMWRGECDLVSLFWALDDCAVSSPKVYAYSMTSGPCAIVLLSKGVECRVLLEPDDTFSESDGD